MKLGLAEGVAARRRDELPPLLKELQVESGEALESLRTLARGCGSARYPRDLEAAVYFLLLGSTSECGSTPARVEGRCRSGAMMEGCISR